MRYLGGSIQPVEYGESPPVERAIKQFIPEPSLKVEKTGTDVTPAMGTDVKKPE